jgi:hypothetical protein
MIDVQVSVFFKLLAKNGEHVTCTSKSYCNTAQSFKKYQNKLFIAFQLFSKLALGRRFVRLKPLVSVQNPTSFKKYTCRYM